jgi:hypothetical protein
LRRRPSRRWCRLAPLVATESWGDRAAQACPFLINV